jgi:hypothetical protein
MGRDTPAPVLPPITTILRANSGPICWLNLRRTAQCGCQLATIRQGAGADRLGLCAQRDYREIAPGRRAGRLTRGSEVYFRSI